VAVAVRAYAEETNRQNHERRTQVEASRCALGKIDRSIKGIMDAIEDGMYQPAMKARMAELAQQKAEIEARLAEAPADLLDIHPNIAEHYRAKVLRLSETLAEPESNGEAREDICSRKVAAEDQLRRIDIRAPISGTVHELNVHTVGGVISAGEQLMLIVPAADRLTVEARVAPQDIDQVRVGQVSALRFSAFSQRTTPEINGVVSRVSADLTTEQRTGISYYTARIAIGPDELARLGDVRLVPGMPVEAFIKTADRTVGSYLTKPLFDQVARAFRER
jgi:HlyD family secretion protein